MTQGAREPKAPLQPKRMRGRPDLHGPCELNIHRNRGNDDRVTQEAAICEVDPEDGNRVGVLVPRIEETAGRTDIHPARDLASLFSDNSAFRELPDADPNACDAFHTLQILELC